MFTVKSISGEGTFFLVKNWEKEKAIWKHGSEIKATDMYKRASAAKGALTKLLKVMDEYKEDAFYLIQIGEDGRSIKEEPLKV